MLTPTGSGDERFYVMSLSDIQPSIVFDWYNAANGKMNTSDTSVNFGSGRKNTEDMIAKCNSKEYGEQDQCSNKHKDMWGQIQTEVNNGWFVPSKAEWSAFAGELGITTSNYSSKGLNSWYWSSSQYSSDSAWNANFSNGYMNNYSVNHRNYYVRLATTF